VTLEGRSFRLRWRWLQLLSRWSLDVSAADGTLLAGGLAVVPNLDLLGDVRGARPEMPAGALVVLDPRAAPRRPTLETLGTSVATILYVESGGTT
jgi:hypothetical protein